MYNKENKKKFLNLTKPNKTFYIAHILVAVVIVLLFGYSMYLSNRNLPEPQQVSANIKSGDYVTFDIGLLTDYFATYEKNSYKEKYYFVSDGQYLMIMKLKDADFRKLSDIYRYTYGETEVEPEKVTMTGVAKKIPSELKKLAIESYNELFPDSTITASNFDTYFTTCYIEANAKPNEEDSIWLNVLCFFGIIYLITMFIMQLTYHLKNKSTLNKIHKAGEFETLLNNFESPDKIVYDNQDFMLLPNYLLDYHRTLKIIKYSDIVWFYEHTLRVNGMESTKNIMIMNRLRKLISVCDKNTIGKNYDIFKLIFSELYKKCPNALIGYSNENIKATSKKNFDNTLLELNQRNASTPDISIVADEVEKNNITISEEIPSNPPYENDKNENTDPIKKK